MIKNPSLSVQQGAATIFVAIILLIAITLVAFLSGKTALMEIKMTANAHRSAQALANAQSAMDFAIGYIDGVGYPVAGLDHDSDGNPDTDILLLSDGTTSAIIFDNNDGTCTSTSTMKSALITAVGESDDSIGRRTLTQCVGTRNLFQGGGPKQTLVSGSVVDLTGSAQIINRYSDLNIWSGSTTDISGSAMATYIRPVDIELVDLTEAELIDDTTSPSIPNVQKVSSGGLGGGTDIYQNDLRLIAAKAISDADISSGGMGDGPGSFFNLFFLDDKVGMAKLADKVGQKFPDGTGASDLDGLSGIVYVTGDASLTGGGVTMGTSLSPAIVIVDGDFSFSGGTITGIVYVSGEVGMAGGATVIGTMIVKDGVDMGSGTSTLVYARNTGDGPTGPVLAGTIAIVSGSWRDW